MKHFALPLIIFCLISLFGLSSSAGAQKPTREKLTIQWLAKTLKRFGEDKLARRLTEDYFVNNRIRFRFIKTADANAETGPNLKGQNIIDLSDNMLNAGDQDQKLRERPYGNNSNLIGDAMTVVHEYIHMDQTLPMNYPRWEDPAWQASDKILSKWTKQIEKEYYDTWKLPPSKERDAKLAELKDIIGKLATEAGLMKNTINANIANGSLSANQKWLLDDTQNRLAALKEDIKKKAAVGALGPKQPGEKKDPGYWELVEVKAFDKLQAGDNNYSLSAGDGSISARWSLANDVFKVTANYTSPPKQIRPNDKLPIQLSVTVSNQGDQYSANGDFSIYFDRPEIEPGTIISPISLKGEKGVTGNIQFSHKSGTTPTPASSLLVYIDGKSLPTGSKGARIALMASLYIGRSASYRYIYEWKDNW